MQPDRLVANDFIQCRKVAEHILEKLLGDGTASSPGCGDADSTTPSSNGYNVDQIELTCNEQVRKIYLNGTVVVLRKRNVFDFIVRFISLF